MQSLYEWMKDIIIFMILVTVIMNLLGKSSFKKYVGIVTGLLLVLYVIKPLIALAGNSDFFDFAFNSYNYKLQSEDMTNKILEMEESSNQAIATEYKKLLMEQTNKLLKSKGLYVTNLNIEVDDDITSETYGTILQMDVKASYYKTENEEAPIQPITIERIKIGDDKVKNKENDEKEVKINSPMEINIKNVLADFYNLDSSNINISIREDHNG